jgi:dihydrofolate synthase/folylpolyglutamate synthase
LGGRLDSTNIINPLISVITNIGLDHTQFLGETEAEIAYEKAGIIKSGIPVVIGEKQINSFSVFQEIATKRNTTLYLADELIVKNYPTDLLGEYQAKNVKTTVQTVQILLQNNYKISEDQLLNGLQNVVKNTSLKGRWQVLQTHPKVVCDTAHNSEGLTLVLNQLQNEEYENLHIILGVVNDKDLESILSLFPQEANYYFCKPNIPRGLEGDILKNKAFKHKLIGEVYDSVEKAYTVALNNANIDVFIYIGGSTFVVAELPL